MGLGGKLDIVNSQTDRSDEKNNAEYFSWEQIRDNKKWIVINGKVYDITNFSRKHPGGERLMMNHVGQDASDAFTAFHTDMKKVNKYMKSLEVGELLPNDNNDNLKEESRNEVVQDFRKLRLLAEKMDLFKTNSLFYILHFSHLILCDLIGWLIIYYSGYQNWFTYFLAVFFLTITQSQAGWLQHDFGHLSVFKSNKLNHFVQRIIICTLKGVSADWWNYRHFQHHAKPNTIRKDPDIRFGALFVLGKIMPRELGEKKKGKFAYNFQQNYFFMIVPPLLLPIYFNLENAYYLTKTKRIGEALWISSFLIRWSLMFVPILGIWGTISLYLITRFFESHWFVWTTQMNHLPMSIDYDNNLSWFKSQLQATCNVEQSWFNDWFSGHLNFQVEHHLFPTMPRHNYHKIAPYVRSMCEKHKVPYIEKTLTGAMADIYNSLKASGELWYEAYNM